jgi:hypothetical protein
MPRSADHDSQRQCSHDVEVRDIALRWSTRNRPCDDVVNVIKPEVPLLPKCGVKGVVRVGSSAYRKTCVMGSMVGFDQH